MEVKEKSQRTRLASDVNSSDIHAYRKFLKETKRSDITYEMFSKIITSVHGEIISKIQAGPYVVKIPGLGTIKLLKVIPKAKPHAMIDWGQYNKTKVWAPYRNAHSNGQVYKIHLYTYMKKYPKLGFFSFHPARVHQRALAQTIKNNDIRL
jgi:hypothetical protein